MYSVSNPGDADRVTGFDLSARLRGGMAVAVLLLTSACGGSGGSGGRVNPVPPPPVAPTPAPPPPPGPTPPPPGTDYNTNEYRATVGAVSMNALASYNRGATGAGITVGVIDTGIDLQSLEFGNRIHAASRDTAGNTTLDDEDGHGTAVAFTIAGRRDGNVPNARSHGVAFDATVLALRTDRPGSCATKVPDDDDSGCRHPESAVAAALDVARTNGARVVNISLGGDTRPGSTLIQAINRATEAGIVIVMSAGNDGNADPGAFASGPALNPSIARGLIVISGSVGPSDVISSFSNRAGASAQVYLTAVGERVIAPGADPASYFYWSGTSFSAPQISGAVALLAQAFPNLTGQQIVDLLFTTARDVGAPGIDNIYGQGVLDLTRAFQPVGATSLASTRAAVSLDTNADLSAPMGDADGGEVGAVILDGYNRAFAIDLATTIRRDGPVRSLAGILSTDRRHLDAAFPGGAVAVTIAPVHGRAGIERLELPMADATVSRAIAASVSGRLGAATQFGFAMSEGAGGLVAGLSGRADPAFLVAGNATRSTGFDVSPSAAVAVRHRLGATGITVAAESGDVLTRMQGGLPAMQARFDRHDYHHLTIAADRRIGALSAGLSLTRLDEADTLLGARFSGAFGAARATSHFLDLSGRLDAGEGWTLGAAMRQGWTVAELRGGFEGSGVLRTNGYAFDIGKAGFFHSTDEWGIRVAQPLRVASGGLDLVLPTHWDYASESVDSWTPQRLNLTPRGRQIDIEMRYATPLGIGHFGGHLFLRRHPGNFAQLSEDMGLVGRYSMRF